MSSSSRQDCCPATALVFSPFLATTTTTKKFVLKRLSWDDDEGRFVDSRLYWTTWSVLTSVMDSHSFLKKDKLTLLSFCGLFVIVSHFWAQLSLPSVDTGEWIAVSHSFKVQEDVRTGIMLLLTFPPWMKGRRDMACYSQQHYDSRS
jgi:hypothetical protein